MSVLALIAALCLAVLVRAPAGRAHRSGSPDEPPATSGGVAGSLGGRGSAGRDGAGGWPGTVPAWRRGMPRAWRRAPRPDLGVVVTEVATRLRSGASAESAWAVTLARAGLVLGGEGGARRVAAGRDRAGWHQAGWGTGVVAAPSDGVPAPLAALLEGPARRGGRRGRGGGTEHAALAATVTACRLTHELGAPLADVLERCAHGITEAAEAQDARHVALAGPRSTARLLGWLPVVGLLLGAGLGADPVATMVDGSWGTASVLAGAGLLVVGHRWTAALVAAAQRGGENA